MEEEEWGRLVDVIEQRQRKKGIKLEKLFNIFPCIKMQFPILAL